MRATTLVWAGFKHVGQRAAEIETTHTSAGQAMTWFAERIAKLTMAQRFDMVLARTKDECLARLGERGAGLTEQSGFDVDDAVWANLEEGIES